MTRTHQRRLVDPYSREEIERVEAMLNRRDPLFLQAADEQDIALIRHQLSLEPLSRLNPAVRAGEFYEALRLRKRASG